jgi:pyruvate,water dikinase
MEFLIMHDIKIHPLALTRFEQVNDEKVKEQINDLTFAYPDKKEYFIERLAQRVANSCSFSSKRCYCKNV